MSVGFQIAEWQRNDGSARASLQFQILIWKIEQAQILTGSFPRAPIFVSTGENLHAAIEGGE